MMKELVTIVGLSASSVKKAIPCQFYMRARNNSFLDAMKRLSFSAGLLAAALTINPMPLRAADWPQWRGPKRDGHSADTGLLKAWPAGGPQRVFKASGLGSGYAAPAVVGDRIYVLGEDDTSSYLRAVDAKEGRVLWSAALGKPGGGKNKYTGPRATPTVDQGRVFAMGQHGDVICVEAADGKEIWRWSAVNEFPGATTPEWSYGESPLVDGDLLLCTPGGTNGTLIALDKRTGKNRWISKAWTDNATYVSILPCEIGGIHQFVQLAERSVAGVGPDGTLLWQAERVGARQIIPTPIVAGNRVYVTSGYVIGCNSFEITRAGDKFSARQVYANKVMVNHHGGVVLLADHLYGYSDNKGWVCQRFDTGDLVWAEKEKLRKGSISSADGMLYLREESTTTGGPSAVVLLEASPKGWSEKGRLTQPDRSAKSSWAHPVIANGRLYLRDQDILLGYDVKQM